MEKFITLNHLKMAVQSLLLKFNTKIDILDNSLSPVAKTGSYNDLTDKPEIQNINNIIGATIETTNIASRDYNQNEFLILNNTLYSTKDFIEKNEQLIINTNIFPTTIIREIVLLSNKVDPLE